MPPERAQPRSAPASEDHTTIAQPVTEIAPGQISEWIDGLVATALELRGAPYKNGGAAPDGFDCSGFTQFVLAQHGLKIPREVREQFMLGRHVERDAMAAGDLVFFETVSPGASHVAIAIGRDQFVHAPSSRGVVRVEQVSASYWSKRLVGVRRLVGR